MKNRRLFIFLLVIVIIIAFVITFGRTYAKYILTKHIEATFSSQPFYFNVEIPDDVVFKRTDNKSDFDIILTETTSFDITVSNNDGTNYNSFDTDYEITIVDNGKFAFVDGDKITKKITGGSLKNDTISLNLKILDMENPLKTFKIKIKTTSPYVKEEEFTLNVIQEGAIQTIEDLVDLSLSVRRIPKVAVESERYKMTRNLDFKNPSSYDNANRSDYGDVNGDDITEQKLMDELTKSYSDSSHPGAGFLPIGMQDEIKEQYYEFKGVFNGGNHSISNLRIHKSKQSDIGLFGFTIGAVIKNLTIIDGDVYNENQTAGMVVGKVQGGIIENVKVEGKSVMAVDSLHTNEDTYSGGIAGYVELKAEIKNCVNMAEVTTRFSGDNTNYSGPSGGICGWMANSTIDHCINYGTITGQKYVGGIAGFSAMHDDLAPDGAGTVSYCGNYGKITTYITGTSSSGPGQYIGGICGYNKAAGIVTDCTNYKEASVSGISNVGTIVGGNYGKAINCHNYSTSITGNSSSSKLFGLQKGTATGCVDHTLSGDVPTEPPTIESTESTENAVDNNNNVINQNSNNNEITDKNNTDIDDNIENIVP